MNDDTVLTYKLANNNSPFWKLTFGLPRLSPAAVEYLQTMEDTLRPIISRPLFEEETNANA